MSNIISTDNSNVDLNNVCENEASKVLISEAITKHGALIDIKPGIKISENIAFLIRITTSSHYGSVFRITDTNSFGFVKKSESEKVS